MNLIIAARNMRGADRSQFYVEQYDNVKYKYSPYYKGAGSWNLLPLHIAISEFRQSFKKEYRTYVDILY